MRTKRFLLFFAAITIAWSLDYGLMVEGVSESVRFVGHLLAFIAVLATGYIYWKKYFKWAAIIWLAAYSCLFLTLISTGLLYKMRVFHNDNLLLDVSNMRLLFTSPVLFTAFYIIVKWNYKHTIGG